MVRMATSMGPRSDAVDMTEDMLAARLKCAPEVSMGF